MRGLPGSCRRSLTCALLSWESVPWHISYKHSVTFRKPQAWLLYEDTLTDTMALKSRHTARWRYFCTRAVKKWNRFGVSQADSGSDRDPGVDELGGRSAVFIISTGLYCTLLRLTGRTDTRTTPNRGALGRLPWQHHQDGQHSAWRDSICPECVS